MVEREREIHFARDLFPTQINHRIHISLGIGFVGPQDGKRIIQNYEEIHQKLLRAHRVSVPIAN